MCIYIITHAIQSRNQQFIGRDKAFVITPNLQEAEVLCGKQLSTVSDMQQAAKELLKFGCKAVLLKGGHLGGNQMVDVLLMVGRTAPRLYSATKVESRNTHGTGCSLSSAIATLLAQGRSLPEAVDGAKTYVREGIRKGKDIEIGSGHGPLNHFFAPIPMKIKE